MESFVHVCAYRGQRRMSAVFFNYFPPYVGTHWLARLVVYRKHFTHWSTSPALDYDCSFRFPKFWLSPLLSLSAPLPLLFSVSSPSFPSPPFFFCYDTGDWASRVFCPLSTCPASGQRPQTWSLVFEVSKYLSTNVSIFLLINLKIISFE